MSDYVILPPKYVSGSYHTQIKSQSLALADQVPVICPHYLWTSPAIFLPGSSVSLWPHWLSRLSSTPGSLLPQGTCLAALCATSTPIARFGSLTHRRLRHCSLKPDVPSNTNPSLTYFVLSCLCTHQKVPQEQGLCFCLLFYPEYPGQCYTQQILNGDCRTDGRMGGWMYEQKGLKLPLCLSKEKMS